MDEHPTSQILKDLLRGRLASKDEKPVIAHLATGCPKCREVVAPTAVVMFRPERAVPVSSSEEEDLYDRAIAAACESTLEQQRDLEQERAEADAKIAKLLQGMKSGKDTRFWTWGLCERLLERSWELRQKNPSEMATLAQYAVEAADRIDSRQYGAQNVADLQTRAWAGLANAYRISDQLDLAERAFSYAFNARGQGTRSPLLQARLAELLASLMCDQRCFPEAFRLLDFAYRTFLKHRAPHDAGRALITRGVHTGWSGDPEEGISKIVQGLRLIEKSRDPKLAFQSLHSILIFRVELGEFKLARRQIWEMRPLYNDHGEQILQVKLRWIEGKIFLGLGEIDRAVRAFQQAKEGFLEKCMNYDAALVSFDLAAIWLGERKLANVQQLLQEMLDIFRARYIAREGIAALIMLRNAANRNEITFAMLERGTTIFEVLKREPKSKSGDVGSAPPL